MMGEQTGEWSPDVGTNRLVNGSMNRLIVLSVYAGIDQTFSTYIYRYRDRVCNLEYIDLLKHMQTVIYPGVAMGH